MRTAMEDPMHETSEFWQHLLRDVEQTMRASRHQGNSAEAEDLLRNALRLAMMVALDESTMDVDQIMERYLADEEFHANVEMSAMLSFGITLAAVRGVQYQD